MAPDPVIESTRPVAPTGALRAWALVGVALAVVGLGATLAWTGSPSRTSPFDRAVTDIELDDSVTIRPLTDAVPFRPVLRQVRSTAASVDTSPRASARTASSASDRTGGGSSGVRNPTVRPPAGGGTGTGNGNAGNGAGNGSDSAPTPDPVTPGPVVPVVTIPTLPALPVAIPPTAITVQLGGSSLPSLGS